MRGRWWQLKKSKIKKVQGEIFDRKNIKLLYSEKREEIISLSSKNQVTKWKMSKNCKDFFQNARQVKSIDFSYNKQEFLPIHIKKYSDFNFFLIEHYTGCIWIVDWDYFEINEGYQVLDDEGAESTDIIYIAEKDLFIAGGGYSSVFFISPKTNTITKGLSRIRDYIDNFHINEKLSLFIHSDIDQDNIYCLCKLDFENYKITTLDRFHGGSRNHYDGITFLGTERKIVCVSKWRNEHTVTLMSYEDNKIKILQERKIKLSIDLKYKYLLKSNVHRIDENLFICGGNKIFIISLPNLNIVDEIEFNFFINDSVLVNNNCQICLGTNEGLFFWSINEK